MNWNELSYWKSEDWSRVQRRLHELDMAEVRYCPEYSGLFKAFTATPFDTVRVAVIGQDPYPDPTYATGLAFSIPPDCSGYPPTLETIFKEYENDLHYPRPSTGDLTPWASDGVFLWNALPSCQAWKSRSHDWPEWDSLTKEVLASLVAKVTIPIVLLGAKAREYESYISLYAGSKSISSIKLISLVHPSPRASLRAKTEAKFIGSRLFSRINDSLCSLGKPKINWRLP